MARKMVIGVPKEATHLESRVGLTPFAVADLTNRGHTVLVEQGAGSAAHFGDVDYEMAGGNIAYSKGEVYGRADLLCRVGRISESELKLLKPGAIVCGFQHLAVAPRELVQRLLDLECTLIGYEVVRDRSGHLAILRPFSEIAGQMSIHIAAHLLQNDQNGRGILMGNVAGVPPPTVVIVGAGGVGRASATKATSIGAHVVVMDNDTRQLDALSRELAGRVVTVLAAEERLRRYTRFADVVIGGVLIPGARAPSLVTEEMVAEMKRGSVIIDISIDQGGCVETSHPTTLQDPTFLSHGVIHYCVPNMTANVGRTASRVLANTALPYLREIADRGTAVAIRENEGLSAGVLICNGKIANRAVGEGFGLPTIHLPYLV